MNLLSQSLDGVRRGRYKSVRPSGLPFLYFLPKTFDGHAMMRAAPEKRTDKKQISRKQLQLTSPSLSRIH